MIKGIFVFLVVWLAIYLAIEVVRLMAGKERLALTKSLAYSAATALLALLAVAGFVFIF